MEDHIEDVEDTISLSGLLFEDDNTIGPEEVSIPNQSSASSSSSSSSSNSSFEQDFLGFFSEEWSRDPCYNTSPEKIIFCGKIISSKPYVSHVGNMETSGEKSALFRSSSDSFRFVKADSRQRTPRSKSLPNYKLSSSSSLSSSLSSCKSKWQVFMFGFGSGKYPTTMDMSDIKSRQIRRQCTAAVVDRKAESSGRRSGKKSWWRLVDVLGCNSGYERDTMVVI